MNGEVSSDTASAPPPTAGGVRATTRRAGVELLMKRALAAGGIVEISHLKSKRGTVCGYFNSVDDAVEALADLSPNLKPEGVYCTLNPLNPVLLARAVNKFKEYVTVRAGNADVLRRLWLPIDADAVRPSGILKNLKTLAGR